MKDTAVPVSGGDLNVWRRQARSGRPTVLLVHGLTGNSRWWEAVINHLPADLGLIVPDLRGRAASWSLPGPYGMRQHADDLSLVIKHFENDPPVVAGYSMGAWVATTMATRHPTVVSGVVMADGGLRIEVPHGLSNEEAVEEIVGPTVQTLSTEFESEAKYLANWLDHPAITPYRSQLRERTLTHGLVGEAPHLKVKADREAVMVDGTEFLVDEEIMDAAVRLSCPAVLITVDHGMLDRPGGFISEAEARRLVEMNPAVDWRPLRSLNHYTLMYGDGAPHVAAAITDLTKGP